MSAIASSSRHSLRSGAWLRPALPQVRLQSTSASPDAPPAPRRRRSETPPKTNVDLIAPPDPLSNIRPVIYASRSTRPPTKSSPYSAAEFPYSEADASLQELELEWRLMRERVDMMNHRFWATTNAEFNAQLAHRLAALPTPSDPPSPADLKRREDCLAQFYADWQAANRQKQARWVREWWGEVWAGLRMQARVHLARLFRR
ncbi:hypothetical protein DB88DRAFT_501619 [Papiliotrema laurentii]|uniref:Uncharacterized protein n=1 Tax=Papiliotrema laurentii TaxID=5418 RepID=A0AAD9CT10_PAPLA|nr:hypothetical protein DB88DRAFT_501619 [Papiliotrema laurentii]